MLAGLALYPMIPTRQTLPAEGPNPPAISTLYTSMAFLIRAAQSMPSGTCKRQREGQGKSHAKGIVSAVRVQI